METEQKPVDYQAVLADLETKREELEHAINAIRRMLGESVTTTSSGQHKRHQSGNELTPTAFFGMSVGDAAKKYLSIIKEPKSAPEIAKALQAHGIKTVSKNFTVTVFSTLERREEAGDFVRPKRGLWGLIEWYPGFRKTQSKENGEQKEAAEELKKAGDQPKPETKLTGSIPPPRRKSA